MRRIEPKLEKKVIEAYETTLVGGHSLANQLGISASTLYRILRRNGVVIDPNKRHELDHGVRRFKFSPEGQAEIAALYAQGVTPKELRARFQCHASTIRECVKRSHAPLLRRGGQRRHWSTSEIQDIVALYKSGKSQEEIAATLKTDQTTVSRILKTSSVDTRRPRWAAHPNWKGGRVKTSGGYMAVLVPPDSPFASMRMSTGYVMEHRLVIAQKLGRPLLPNESVHHINGKSEDNRLENLEVRVGKHGTGVVMVCAECGSRHLKAVTIA